MKIAIVGATGLVGSKMLEEIHRLHLNYDQLLLAASERSVGKKVQLQDKEHTVISIQDALEAKPDIALFSAGGAVSAEWAPKFAEVGTRVVDNSSQWRMDKRYKLIVPEINGHLLNKDDYIIANPNCSTIQMVLGLYPLQKKYGIKRIVVSTYQSVSGSGQSGIDQLLAERAGKTPENICYKDPIDLNVIPQIDVFLEDNYTKEEHKMMDETQKIYDDTQLMVSATTVRVPVIGGHSLSCNISLQKAYNIEEVKQAIQEQEGVQVIDDPAQSKYPMPLYCKEDPIVYVGRIREDLSYPHTLNCWIVADNLLKGAATNAVQIAQKLSAII